MYCPELPHDSGATLGIGHLTQVSNANSTASYSEYDPLGRVKQSSQTTNGQTYGFGYLYNLADALTKETYPSGRAVTTGYDAVNRPNGISGALSGQSTSYVSDVGYWAHGAPNSYVLGAAMYAVYSYNSRLQMSSFYAKLGNAANGYVAAWNYDWGGADNNGNLKTVTQRAGAPGTIESLPVFTQSFNYDGVNRLQHGQDSGGWSRDFGYDQYGNMWVTNYTGVPLAGNTPTSNVYSSNRIGGQSYDASGNQLSVNGDTLFFDAENRMMSATEPVSLGGGTETYLYDGDGRRVEKTGPGGATVYVYDALGQLAAEYSTTANSSPCSTCYLTNDHLGSVRLVTDQSGNVVARHDYLPFGEEIAAGAAGRGTQWGAWNDSVKQKFTGKERDSETGLDYFGARYYGAALGRWTSPDPMFLASNRLVNPQRWNMYGYALNNPLKYIDPDGQDSMYVVFKDFRPSIFGVRTLALGHAGMVVVDKSGHTTYREFGRYDTNQGETRGQNVPNLQMDVNGHPTDASMQELIKTMSSENQNGSVDVIYYDTTDDVDTLLLKELARRVAENKDSKRPSYNFDDHNCGTLFCETMRVAGQSIPAPAKRAAPVDTLQMLLMNSQWWADYSYDPKTKETKKKEKVTSTITYIQ